MRPKITIIVPVYNVAPYVEKCIMSILNQDYDDLEVIIVDDCGNDESMHIVEKVLHDNPSGIDFRIIHHERNKGVSAARNSGFMASTGDYIMYVDSDDCLTLGCCSMLASIVEGNDVDIIVGNRDIIDFNTGRNLCTEERCATERLLADIKDYDAFPLQGEVYNKLIRRDFIEKYGLYFTTGIVFEDTLWFKQILCHLPKVLYVPFVTYIYNVHSDSTMTTCSLQHMKSIISVYIYMRQYIIRCPESTRWYAAREAYNFYKAALSHVYMKSTRPMKSFFTCHRLLKKHYPVADFIAMTGGCLSKIQKYRLKAAELPCPLDSVVEYMFIRIKTFQMKRAFIQSAPIDIPDDFLADTVMSIPEQGDI